MLRARLAAFFFLFTVLAFPAELRSRNVILITADGLRWQDLFHGIDPLLAPEKSVSVDPASKDADGRRARFANREALAPFFWITIAKNGVVLNNVNITNSFRVSYPGYSEILTGRATDDVITGNIDVQQPNETVLEFLKCKLSLAKDRVALSPWDEARHDAFTFELALDYLKKQHPRALAISFDETDDWAHAKRYDRVLDMIHATDGFLNRLWTTIQGMPEYRDSTTLIVTSDHGRGSSLSDWSGHGSKVQGADRIWMALWDPIRPPRAKSPPTPKSATSHLPSLADGLQPTTSAQRAHRSKPPSGRKLLLDVLCIDSVVLFFFLLSLDVRNPFFHPGRLRSVLQ
jgi:hypothetical protein